VHRNQSAAFTLIELLVVIAVIAVIAAILFPVFAQAWDRARQAACFANLKQIGGALSMYVQDYDERLPNVCRWGRAWTWVGAWYPKLTSLGLGTGGNDLTGSCAQVGITRATPKGTFLGPDQRPPHYIQELLHPYVKNSQIWFCPSVSKDRFFEGDRTEPTYGFNGTTYFWNWIADPTGTAMAPNPFRQRPPMPTTALPLASIPRPSAAPVVWDMPQSNPIQPPCTQMDFRPAHAKGVNVLYADTHVKFSPYSNRTSPGDCAENWWADHNWEGYYE
jgi:prepilin-type N-terminal cleavage/methylation domain-containing protein/prepilin-type processing-associated H-X9-DG protein